MAKKATKVIISQETLDIIEDGRKLEKQFTNRGLVSSLTGVVKSVAGLLGLVASESIGYAAHRAAESKKTRPLATEIRQSRRRRELLAELKAERELGEE